MKENCNLIGQEARLATPSKEKIFSGTTFVDDYLHAKNLKTSTDSFQRYL